MSIGKEKIVLGAQLYTVRDRMTDKASVLEGLSRISRMGYGAVQLSAVPAASNDPAWFRGACDEAGLSICSTHTDFRRIIEDTDAVIAEHKIMGCGQIGIGYMPDSFETKSGEKLNFKGSATNVMSFIEAIRPAAERIEKAGFHLFYHNHRFEFEKIDGVLIMDMLINELPQLWFLPDIYWLWAGGIDPVKFIRKISGRMDQIHFKDYGIRGDAAFICEIGRGNLDFIDIAKTALSCGVPGFVVEQDTCDGDPYDSLQMSIDFIRSGILPNI